VTLALRWLRRNAIVIVAFAAIDLGIIGAVLCEGALHVPHDPFRAGSYPDLAEVRADDGITLRGDFLRPAGRSVGCVIVLHGIGDSHLSMSGYAALFRNNGYSVLLPDSRGHGWSDAALTTYGVREAHDVARWVDWLQGHGCGQEVYGLGESLGGSALLQSLAFETRFRAVVAECPFATFPAIGRDRLDRFIPLPNWMADVVTVPVVYSGMAYANIFHGLNLGRASAVEGVRSTRTPVLLIHGDLDSKTPLAHSLAIRAANPSVVQLWEVPGARHTGAWSAAPTEFPRRVVAWFQCHSGSLGAPA
jgi:pimeloyl-ACP methyl ester carboxylesterase